MLKQQLAFVTQMLSMNTPLPASLSYTATSSSNDFLPTSIHEMAPDTTSTPRPDGSHRRTVFPRRNPSYQTPVKHKGPAGYSASNTETSLITHPESSHSKEMASALNHVEVNSFSEEVLNLPKLRRRHSLPDDKDNEVVNNDLTTASTKDAVILCDNMERNEGHDESKYYDNYLLQDVERGFVRKFISHESGLRSNRFVHHGSRFPLRTKHMSKKIRLFTLRNLLILNATLLSLPKQMVTLVWRKKSAESETWDTCLIPRLVQALHPQYPPVI